MTDLDAIPSNTKGYAGMEVYVVFVPASYHPERKSKIVAVCMTRQLARVLCAVDATYEFALASTTPVIEGNGDFQLYNFNDIAYGSKARA